MDFKNAELNNTGSTQSGSGSTGSDGSEVGGIRQSKRDVFSAREALTMRLKAHHDMRVARLPETLTSPGTAKSGSSQPFSSVAKGTDTRSPLPGRALNGNVSPLGSGSVTPISKRGPFGSKVIERMEKDYTGQVDLAAGLKAAHNASQGKNFSPYRQKEWGSVDSVDSVEARGAMSPIMPPSPVLQGVTRKRSERMAMAKRAASRDKNRIEEFSMFMDDFLDQVNEDSDGSDSPGLSTIGGHTPFIPPETPYSAWGGQGPFSSLPFPSQVQLPAREGPPFSQAQMVPKARQDPREVAQYQAAMERAAQQKIQQQMEEEFMAMQQDMLKQRQELQMQQQQLFQQHMQQQIQQEMHAQMMQQFMACQMGYPPMPGPDGVMVVPVPVPVPAGKSRVPGAPGGPGLHGVPAVPSVPFQIPPGFKLVPEPRVEAAPQRADIVLENFLPGQSRKLKPQDTMPKEPTKKIFVGGLCPDSTADSLRNHFQLFGEIADSVVINQPGTKKCRGFGFVEFVSGIPQGLFDRQHVVDQRRCGVKPYSNAAC